MSRFSEENAPPEFRTVECSDPRWERDGLRQVTAKSPALAQRADLTLHVPEAARAEGAAGVPVVILLHGVYGSHWAWTGKAGAHATNERLAREDGRMPFVLAMPSDGLWGDGSGYVAHRTQDFERWIVDEVPALVRRVVPAVTDASGWYIAGLSMGGFGALRIGAKYAERFRGMAGHSSITELAQMKAFVIEAPGSFTALEEDRSVLDTMLRRRGRLPAVRFDCGTDDPLLDANRALHRELERAGVEHVYEEFPGGHEWAYWETHLADTLRFFASLEP